LNALELDHARDSRWHERRGQEQEQLPTGPRDHFTRA
jgi:hypothetical protein